MAISMRRFIYLIIIIFSLPIFAKAQLSKEAVRKVETSVAAELGKRPAMFLRWTSATTVPVSLDRVSFNQATKRFGVYFATRLKFIPMREELIAEWEAEIRKAITKVDEKYADYGIRIYAKTTPIETLIPNAYRRRKPVDKTRKAVPKNTTQLVRNNARPVFDKGLSGRHIALWSGHGNYYSQKKSRWEWQRAKLFGNVEDLGAFALLNDYIVPMLENAGAVTISPKERDRQSMGLIADNDGSNEGCMIEKSAGWSEIPKGFKYKAVIESENPFKGGTSLKASASRPVSLTYKFTIPQADDYGVYVSWQSLPTNLTDAMYRVKHSGGQTDFVVNQRIGGGTWVYLGHFRFDGEAEITLSGYGEGTVTSDAVRLGGGMGNVTRGGNVSGLPRYMEGARYYMQYSGIPYSIYSTSEGKDDYEDDYKSRGDWVNYMRDNLGIPFDLSFAMHTDAGICDSIIGTMAVCYPEGNFSKGGDRSTSRDMADMIQTQIVDDARRLTDPRWTRRMLFDKRYSESWRPDVPAMILELLSHQNLNDMNRLWDPVFRFNVARSIYKGMLRYLADRYGMPYVVQPLPPTAPALSIIEGCKLKLSWKPVADPLEPSATADKYIIYSRKNNNGFDNGTVVTGTSAEIELPSWGDTYGFKITAVNAGGESFPSEILTACLLENNIKPALIINGFTRLSAPAYSSEADRKGLDHTTDYGVPYIHQDAYIGDQYDYNPTSAFINNDNPGWGASNDKYLGRGLGGNTFDYTGLHGGAFVAADISYVSAAAAAFESGMFSPTAFSALDIYFGVQKNDGRFTLYTPQLIGHVEKFRSAGVPIIVSGANLGDTGDITDHVAKVLGFNPTSEKIENSEEQASISTSDLSIVHKGVVVNSSAGSSNFAVRRFDVINPAGEAYKPIYLGGDKSSVIGVTEPGRLAVFSLPMEAVADREAATEFLSTVVSSLKAGRRTSAPVNNKQTAKLPEQAKEQHPEKNEKSADTPTENKNETIRYDKQSAYPVRVATPEDRGSRRRKK